MNRWYRRWLVALALTAVLLLPLRLIPDRWSNGEHGVWLTYAGHAFCVVNVSRPYVFLFWDGNLSGPSLLLGRKR